MDLNEEEKMKKFIFSFIVVAMLFSTSNVFAVDYTEIERTDEYTKATKYFKEISVPATSVRSVGLPEYETHTVEMSKEDYENELANMDEGISPMSASSTSTSYYTLSILVAQNLNGVRNVQADINWDKKTPAAKLLQQYDILSVTYGVSGVPTGTYSTALEYTKSGTSHRTNVYSDATVPQGNANGLRDMPTDSVLSTSAKFAMPTGSIQTLRYYYNFYLRNIASGNKVCAVINHQTSFFAGPSLNVTPLASYATIIEGLTSHYETNFVCLLAD